ncbi:MAG: type II toxin-antitoxin system RelE/ParE family toxin [Gemmatimonadaceae bacterium]|nr:type II toxin-antitoxin system RelE/ParE family toxin [Caulobacter sp.]
MRNASLTTTSIGSRNVRHPPSAARRAALQLFDAIDRLLDFPESAPDIGRGQREAVMRFGRDGFVLGYRISGQAVIIQRIYHGLQQRD